MALATAAATAPAPSNLRPPSADRLGTGMVLALAAHAGLVAALALATQWRIHTPATASAELWAAVPQAAAPRVEAPPPAVPMPAPPPAPTPVPSPAPPPAAAREAQIAVEQAERQRSEQAERERADRERATREAAQREKAEKEKAERDERRRQEQAAADKRRQEQELAEKRRQEQAAIEKRRQDEARAEELRRQQLQRMMGQAQTPSGTGAPGAAGTAARDAAPSDGYAGRVMARIKPNIVFTDDLPGNPVAEVEVRTAPDGSILSRRLVRSSGVPEWDQAVLRAIDRTATLPRDTDGRIPSTITILFRPRE